MFAKTTTLLLTALSLGATGLVAQAVATTPTTGLAGNDNKLTIDYTADVGIVTKHVFRGLKYSNKAITAGALVQFPDQHLYGGLYTVQPLDGADNSEFDVYLGITDKLNDWLNYDFGLTYYYYPNKLSDTIQSAFEPYFGLTANIPQVKGLAVSGYLYFDFERTAFTAELAASYTRHIVEKLSGRLSIFTGYVDGSDFTPEAAGPDVSENYVYYGASFDLPYRLTDKLTITLGVQYSDTSGIETLGNGGSQFWGTGRVTYNF
ncbi:hypothetical protein Ga0100231_010385 [Opitutaceae bacterium TAV4]|nr:hypothetical protein Ga0100231_010385 [Opitutaceae bacterium TAV4]RRJ98752.1 hypothetical protein Ga0100230_010490 [Opitutaceae bacterium TAV3]